MDPLLIPVQLAIIACYRFRFSLIGRLPEPSRTRFTMLAADMRCIIGTWWNTIVVPVVLVLLASVVWLGLYLAVFHRYPEIPVPDPLVGYVLVSCILAPISEEILQGVFLSACFVVFSRRCQDSPNLPFLLTGAVVFTAVLFAFSHDNPAPVNWLVRFFLFVIYGGLYYLHDRNLLPAIVAHAAWNGMLPVIGAVIAG